MELRLLALEAFCQADPDAKVAAVMALDRIAVLDCQTRLVHTGEPGRPPRPVLVHPQQVPRRSPYTAEGHCALMHAIAHIEFNAIKIEYNECSI